MCEEEFWLELAYLVPVVSVCTNTNILNYCLNGHGYCELMAKSLVFPSCGMGAPIGDLKRFIKSLVNVPRYWQQRKIEIAGSNNNFSYIHALVIQM